MPKGSFVNSSVTFSNVAPGTYNGLTDTQLTGTFAINNVDLDSYTITVSGGNATSSSRVGPDGILATKNRQYDSLYPVINQLVPVGSELDWSILTTTGKSPHNNSFTTQEPYVKDTIFTAIDVNTTSSFSTPRMIASTVNENNNIAGNTSFAKKSLVMNGTLSTTLDNLSPIIDTQRLSAIVINSRIDDQTFVNETIAVMDVGISVTSTITNSLTFASQTLLSVVAVTGSGYSIAETVTGAVSGATGVVVLWNSLNLTLNSVVGSFQIGEALVGGSSNSAGTVHSQQVINTITNPNSVIDFTIFTPGYYVTISGCTQTANNHSISSPVTVLSVNNNVITVDTHGSPFLAASSENAVTLTQYTRFVAETGPGNCSGSARYITRQFTLTNPSNSLHVYFDINRPSGSFVDCYYRVSRPNVTQDFNSLAWNLMTIDSSTDSNSSSNPNEFKEYLYTADQIGLFDSFAIKLVMRGGNSSQVPRILDFRCLSLST